MNGISNRLGKATVLDINAIEAANRYKKSEADIIQILKEFEKEKLFRELGFTSLFDYAVKRLKLSKDVAYNFITITRKSLVIPEIHQAIENKEITVSNAKRICSVVTPENKSHWLELAKELPEHKLEKEIARVNPKVLTPEKVKYVTENRLLLSAGISEDLHEKVKRVQDLESQRQGRAISLEDTLKVMAELYLKTHDPLVKARRIEEKKARKRGEPACGEIENHGSKANTWDAANKLRKPETLNSPNKDSVVLYVKSPDPQDHESRLHQCESLEELMELGARRVEELLHIARNAKIPSRKPLSARLKREITLRDNGQCSEPDCVNTRWLEKHHVIPVSHGGTNTAGNLQTLCWAHHQMKHGS